MQKEPPYFPTPVCGKSDEDREDGDENGACAGWDGPNFAQDGTEFVVGPDASVDDVGHFDGRS
jgi:hypothetical protein